MAPKRKRDGLSAASSFTNCPACQMKVATCLMNVHLDWDCKVFNECNTIKTRKRTSSLDLDCGLKPYVNSKTSGFDCSSDDSKTLEEISCVKFPNTCQRCYNMSENSLTHPIIENKVVDVEKISHGMEHRNSTFKTRKNIEWRFIPISPLKMVPKGNHVIENFISEKEERDIISFLDMDLKNPWRLGSFNGLNSTKCYGLRINLGTRCIQPEIFKIPEIVLPILERLRTNVLVLKDFQPNETNAISYYKNDGHWLKPHVDDRQLSGTIIVNFSLCGDCKMTYTREKGRQESFKVLLRRRSIQIQTGECRYNFMHSIANEDLLSPRRLSMTFRQSLLP